MLGQSTWTGTSANDGESAVNARGFGQVGGACFHGTLSTCATTATTASSAGMAGRPRWGKPRISSSAAGLHLVDAEQRRDLEGDAELGIDAGNGLDCAGGRLAMADTGNHRVLIWNTAPTQGGVPADVVLGQSAGDQGGSGGAGGTGVGGLLSPRASSPSTAAEDEPRSSSRTRARTGSSSGTTPKQTAPPSTASTASRTARRPRRTRAGCRWARSTARSFSPSTTRIDSGSATSTTAGRFASTSTTLPPSAVFGQRSGFSTEFVSRQLLFHSHGLDARDEGRAQPGPHERLFTTAFHRGMFWDSPPRDGQTPVTAVQGQPNVDVVAVRADLGHLPRPATAPR